MMDSIKGLNIKRGQIKGQLTRFANFISGYTEDQYDQLKLRNQNIVPLLEQFNELIFQSCIVDTDENKEGFYELERVEFENKYYSEVAKAERLLKPVTVSGSSGMPGAKIKLPEQKLPFFNGEYSEWPLFKDLFKSLIVENVALSGAQKLRYLLPQLSNTAKDVVKDVAICDENFEVVWKLLVDRFENKRFSMNTYIKNIVEFPNIVNEKYKVMRSFLDTINQNIRSLKTLKLPVESWDDLLLYLLVNKLDFASRKLWEMEINKNELPNMQQFLAFLNKRCELLEALQRPNETKEIVKNKNNVGFNVKAHKVNAMATFHVKCPLCNENHWLNQCKELLNLNVEERYNKVLPLRVCFNCFKPNHTSRECRNKRCSKCNKRHNVLLHKNVDTEQVQSTLSAICVEETNFSNENKHELACTSSLSCVNNNKGECHVLLPTAIVFVEDCEKNMQECTVLLDSGSQSNFVTEQLIKKLKLNKFKRFLTVGGIGDKIENLKYYSKISFKSMVNDYQNTVDCFIIPEITGILEPLPINVKSLKIPSNVDLADKDFQNKKRIDMLLGAGVFFNLLKCGRIYLGKGFPMLCETELGYILTGSLNYKRPQPNKSFAGCTLTKSLEQFWSVENFEEPMLTQEEKKCEEIFKITTKRNKEGRFVVDLPFKENTNCLGNTRRIAEKRFINLERKIVKDKNVYEEYKEFIEKYESLGHMKRIDENITDGYFVPHRAVIRPGHISCPLRVVFDFSCPSDNNVSLNDILMTGPLYQSSLFAILLRIRLHKYVITGDLEKMYRQILVNPEQTKFQRIFWRDKEGDLTLYELLTLTYGENCAPYLATRVLKELAEIYKDKYPKAVKLILEQMYMDDLLFSMDNEKEAKMVLSQIIEIFSSAQFNLRKFSSNNMDVLKELNSEKSELKIISLDKTDNNKLLGIYWNPYSDTFVYTLNKNDLVLTKRQMLSKISSIFDPIGLINPVVVTAKLFMQELWSENIDWDDKINGNLMKKWNKFQTELPLLNDLKVKRQVVCNNACQIELHAFCDSSEKAFGGAIYLRSLDNLGNICVSLLTAKSRVAPLKKLTLPKLELCGAVLLAKLVDKVIKTLSANIEKIFYYTDSEIVLAWINSDAGRWKVFVSNRIGVIQTLTDPSSWFHVSSKNNCADILSRGCYPSQLLESQEWFCGPEYLYDRNFQCHSRDINTNVTCPEEKAKGSLKGALVATVQEVESFQLFNRYSDLNKLIRVGCYMFRFVDRLKHKEKYKSENLSVRETNECLNRLIKIAQGETLRKEMQELSKTGMLKKGTQISNLNPFVDEHNILRVGGRLTHSDLDYGNKHPKILPKNHMLTKLIIKDFHIRNLHCGPQSLLAFVRELYWPIGGRESVRNLYRNCQICFRANPKVNVVQMGNLPSVRVTQANPFVHSGVDLTGAFYIRDKKGRGCKMIKVYVALFICLATKACHLELLTDLSTECFLAGLKRFVSRRGVPSIMYSDNGRNFVGASKELKRIYEFLSETSLVNMTNELLKLKIEWKFIPPYSPTWGGIWESNIKQMKMLLKKYTDSTNFTYEEFYTLLVQAEAILNSRPLSPLSNNADDLNPLCPALFLIGRPLNAVAQEDYQVINKHRLSNLQHVQKVTQHLWSRWKREYLQELQKRQKWKYDGSPPIKVGDMVIIKSDQTPPCMWPLARVQEIHPDSNNKVRLVTLKTAQGLTQRTINKVCKLPEED